MIPLNDAEFNGLSWEAVDGKELDGFIEGLTVIGSEPTDYPLTDAITLYLKDNAGQLFALDIGADLYGDESRFYINRAIVPIKEEAAP